MLLEGEETKLVLLLFCPQKGVKYSADEYVCFSVCLSARITRKLHSQFSPVVVAQSIFKGIVMSCTTGLWMTSCIHIMALWHVMCIPKQQWNMTSIIAKISTKFCSTMMTTNTHRELCTRGEFCYL